MFMSGAGKVRRRYILHTCPNLWWRSCSKCYGMDCFGTYFTRVQTCDDVRAQSATEWTASAHTSHMSKPVMTFVFKVLRNGLLRYILHTCPNLWWRSCSKCYGMDCFGTYFTHVQSVITFVFKVLRNGLLRYRLHTCPNLWWRSCSKCYGMDCFGTYFTLVRTCSCPNLWWRLCSKFYGMDCFGTYFTHATCPNLWWRSCSKCHRMDCFGTFTQACDDVRVQSATEWTASVHSGHMSKPVMTFVFKVLRNGLLRYILHTCPNLWWRSCSESYGMDCFGTYFTHVQTCDDVRVQSATEWTASVHTGHMSKSVMTFVFKVLRNGPASVHTSHMSKPVMTFVFKVLRNGLLRYIYFTHVQTCDDVRVQSATEWTASVHTSHMSKSVMTFVFKVLRNGLLRYILHTRPNLWWRSCSKCYGMDCFGTYSTHVQTCPKDSCSQSGTSKAHTY